MILGVKYGIGRHTYDLTKDANIALTVSLRSIYMRVSDGFFLNFFFATLGLRCETNNTTKLDGLYRADSLCHFTSMRQDIALAVPTAHLPNRCRAASFALPVDLRPLFLRHQRLPLCISVRHARVLLLQDHGRCDDPRRCLSGATGRLLPHGGNQHRDRSCYLATAGSYDREGPSDKEGKAGSGLGVPTRWNVSLGYTGWNFALTVYLFSAVGASIVRPVYLRDIMEDGDPTWKLVNVSVWAM